MTENEYRLWFCASVMDVPLRRKLLRAFGSPEGVFYAGEEAIREVGGLTKTETDRIVRTCSERHVERIQRELDRLDASFVWNDAPQFPKCLKEIPDPPLGLFYQGRLPTESRIAVAIVGTRQSSPYGETVAYRFGRILGDTGIAVVSGLAMGIDVASHRGALESGGITYAVLGSGIGTAYPLENIDTYREITKHGCVLSEYGPNVPGLKHHFPTRNRLISGLSEAVIVVEAKLQSGTMITVDRALEQGKEVFAVPGRITDRNSDGCHKLIKQGAQLVTDPVEVLAVIREKMGGLALQTEPNGQLCLTTFENGNEKKQKLPLASEEKMVYASLRLSPKSFDQLVWECGLTPALLLQTLYKLQKQGRIRQATDGLYRAEDPDIAVRL
ncbi:MAG: DNA-processing protein DprA [Lachnospiraceae bacterium]|nr:DNA-processing protein DprA [Lachnospiraceae bacterium]